jgi:hypothetical protein
VWYVETGTPPRPLDHKPYDQLQVLSKSNATPPRPLDHKPYDQLQVFSKSNATPLPRSSSSNTALQAAPTAAPEPAPVLWCQHFPLSIQQQLVSFASPTGTVKNSDLELAGVIAHQDVLDPHFDIRDSTTATLCDNTVFGSRKGSTTKLKSPAYLLRL